MSAPDLNDDDEELLTIASDLSQERLCAVGLLVRLQELGGDRVRLRAQALLKAIETAWPRNASDMIGDDVHADAADRAKEDGADQRDEDARRNVEINAEIGALRR